VTAQIALAAVPSRGAGGCDDRGWWLRTNGSVGARCPAAQGGLAARAAKSTKLRR
jgi:hypothetical protein